MTDPANKSKAFLQIIEEFKVHLSKKSLAIHEDTTKLNAEKLRMLKRIRTIVARDYSLSWRPLSINFAAVYKSMHNEHVNLKNQLADVEASIEVNKQKALETHSIQLDIDKLIEHYKKEVVDKPLMTKSKLEIKED